MLRDDESDDDKVETKNMKRDDQKDSQGYVDESPRSYPFQPPKISTTEKGVTLNNSSGPPTHQANDDQGIVVKESITAGLPPLPQMSKPHVYCFTGNRVHTLVYEED